MKQRFYRMLSRLGVPALMRGLHRRDLTIVMYHGFTDRERAPGIENIGGLHLHTGTFERHLELLAWHYNVISLEEALDGLQSGAALPERAAVITMDDGYRSNHRLALPLLRKYSMPAAIFIATGFVDDREYLWTDRVEYAVNRAAESDIRGIEGDFGISLATTDTAEARGRFLYDLKGSLKSIPQAEREARVAHIEEALGHSLAESDDVPAIYEPLDWTEVSELLDSGLVSIGSHSASHFILANCEDDVITHEIDTARAIIENRTGLDCPLFCYPNGAVGDFDERTRRAVGEAGHRCALTTVSDFNRVGADPYTLARRGVLNTQTLVDFEMSLCGIARIVRRGADAIRKFMPSR